MDLAEAREFVQAWLDAWNAHDVEAVLSNFADNATFTSPIAARLLDETGGVVHGKEALRDYWQKGLSLMPDLRLAQPPTATAL